MVIADTGFWVALYNRRDRHHQAALDAAERYDAEGFITTHVVIAEACHLLHRREHAGVMLQFIEALRDGPVEIMDLRVDDLAQIARLMHKYRELPMDYADASLVLLAEYLGHGRILTTDRRDFGSYRWKSRHPFESLMDTL
ncbi:type II toxin-antitoxin system VapC family toxin [Sinimarinibacterium thermocellulolyticum]|uniref:PIN domain-containing protein n=1 Tax=Sinimarinibacterium thermocellulolyticum TaxID=3170016 RepID=A0ABV2A7Q7_9GAMM